MSDGVEWIDSGPSVTEEDVAKFEVSTGVSLLAERRTFLINVVNGARHDRIAPILAEGNPYVAGDLDGIYGIYHPLSSQDLAGPLVAFSSHLPRFVPFTYDEVKGQVFIDSEVDPGRVVFIPWDAIGDYQEHPNHVANSIAEFIGSSEAMAHELS